MITAPLASVTTTGLLYTQNDQLNTLWPDLLT